MVEQLLIRNKQINNPIKYILGINLHLENIIKIHKQSITVRRMSIINIIKVKFREIPKMKIKTRLPLKRREHQFPCLEPDKLTRIYLYPEGARLENHRDSLYKIDGHPA